MSFLKKLLKKEEGRRQNTENGGQHVVGDGGGRRRSSTKAKEKCAGSDGTSVKDEERTGPPVSHHQRSFSSNSHRAHLNHSSPRGSPDSPRHRSSGSQGSPVRRPRSASVSCGNSSRKVPSPSPSTRSGPTVTTTTVEIKTPTSRHCAQVLPGLLLGSQEIAQDLHWLERHHVTHILNITTEVQNSFTDKFFYKRISITDMPNTPITAHFENAYEFIEDSRSHGGCVLVHCFYGASRSASIVMAYLMRKERMRYDEALKYLQLLRPGVHPNDGFHKQLKIYEAELNLIR